MPTDDTTAPVDWAEAWEIGWSREVFVSRKLDSRFPALLTIARLRNMLRFVQGLVVYPAPELKGPAERRHTLNTLLLMNALLVEAERVINGTGEHFLGHTPYRSLAEAVNEPRMREVIRRSRQARHWSVFHFFTKGAEAVLDRGYFANPPDFVPLMSGHGLLDFNIHADLADMVPIELMLDGIDRTLLEENFKEWLADSSAATTALLGTLDKFLAAMAAEFGAVARQSPRPSEPKL